MATGYAVLNAFLAQTGLSLLHHEAVLRPEVEAYTQDVDLRKAILSALPAARVGAQRLLPFFCPLAFVLSPFLSFPSLMLSLLRSGSRSSLSSLSLLRITHALSSLQANARKTLCTSYAKNLLQEHSDIKMPTDKKSKAEVGLHSLHSLPPPFVSPCRISVGTSSLYSRVSCPSFATHSCFPFPPCY